LDGELWKQFFVELLVNVNIIIFKVLSSVIFMLHLTFLVTEENNFRAPKTQTNP
jgi:hypothetical protein